MILETERLILRQWQNSDRPTFCEMNADPVVMQYFPKTLTSEESNAFIDKTIQLIDTQGWGLFAVELKENQSFIGFVGLAVPGFDLPFMPCVEIGWRIHKPFWLQGYASEAAKSVLEFAFSKLELGEVVSFTSEINIPSIKVMEKIGMKKDISSSFLHPKVEEGHVLRKHVLYRIAKQKT